MTAQTVLAQLRALGRQPTPENYTDLYCQLAGEPNPFANLAQADVPAAPASPQPEVSPLCRELLDMIHDQTVNGAMSTTEHLSLDLGDVHQVQVKFTDRAGKAVERDMRGVIAGLREGEHFYREVCPAGSWTFTGPKGLKVIQRYDNKQIDYTWLVAYPKTLNPGSGGR